MNGLSDFGKILVIIGLFLVIFGLLIIFLPRIPFNFFRLPGDIYYERDGFRFYFPIVTSLLISVILTIVLNLIFYFISKK